MMETPQVGDRQERELVLKDKIVLMTGVTGKLGRRLVESFSSAGATLALSVRRYEDVAPLEREILDRNADAVVFPCDLHHEEDVVRMVHRVVQRFRRIDVVVNCAAVIGPQLSLVEYPTEPWRNVISTNLTGTFLLCREVLPWMIRQGSGSIVNVTNQLARTVKSEGGAHLISMRGIEGLTQLLSEELRGSGVRINTVDVGTLLQATRTRDLEGDWPDAFLWLASDASRSISGEQIRAAGFSRSAYSRSMH